jgi:hypothetical protein
MKEVRQDYQALQKQLDLNYKQTEELGSKVKDLRTLQMLSTQIQ